MSELRYDKYGRLMYHPEFHPRHGKPFTKEELEYICKFHDIDGIKSVALAIGKTEACVAEKIRRLKREGLYDRYKQSWDERVKRA